MKRIKGYNEEQIEEMFDKLSNKKKAEILEAALNPMQQANWRSRNNCIALAMGYDYNEGGYETYIKINNDI